MNIGFHPGASGLVIGDLSLRLYAGAVEIAAPGVGLVAAATTIDYTITNVPDTADTVTAEYPAGVWHAWRFGQAQTRPARFIVPIREAGHDLASLGVVVFKDGAVYGGALTVAEVGDVGDWSVSGWPAPLLGERWEIRWEYAGLTFAHSWTGLVPTVGSSTRYLQILAVQRPFGIGLDDASRPMLSVNFEAEAAAPVNSWEEDLVAVLEGEGLATLGTDTFIGRAASVPQGSGPFVSVIDTGGSAPYATHNGDLYENLSAQIVVRAATYTAARTRALAIWRALEGRRNLLIAA